MFFNIRYYYKKIVGEKISIKNKIFLVSITLLILLTITAISAEDIANETSDTLTENIVDETPLQQTSQPLTTDNQTSPIKTNLESNDTAIIKENEYSVKLTDENGTALANKTVSINFNKLTTDVITDDEGIAKLKITADPGKYTIKSTFNQSGYTTSTLSHDLLVVSTKTSKIKGSSYTAYIGVKNKYTVQLTVGGMPLEGRTVTFTFQGKTFTKKTNADGKASININSNKKGKFNIFYSYGGENNINAASGSSKITVKKGAPVKISKYYSKTYRNKQSGKFKIKLKDVQGNLLAGKKVKFTINKKTYTKKTNKDGIATVTIKLKTGSYKVKVKFAKTSVYNAASKSYSIKVKSKHPGNNGMWLFGRDMKSVNLKTLKKYGFKHVFLNAKAIELYGTKGVEKWIKSAKTQGIKVHIWMQVFYDNGNWKNPVTNSKIINDKVKEAKKYAKIKGAAGIHFDYVRYPGNAYNYGGAVNAVNSFVKKATKAVHGVNKKLIVSAAVMPEPSSMKKYYAQDIPTMGKYLDAIIPMVYKGNYNAGHSWIKWVTKTFAKQSKKAQIWTGLQSYKSDASLKKLSAKELKGDAEAAASAGAKGIILFRYGLFNYINFNEV